MTADEWSEDEWLECTEPESMVAFACGKASERKRRLLAVAACRRIWHLISEEPSRQAVEMAARLADGLADEKERSKAEEAARDVAVAAFDRWEQELTQVAAAGIGYWAATAAAGTLSLAEKEIEEVVSDAGMALAWSEDEYLAAGPAYWPGIELSGPWADLIRDVFGNPFRPLTLDPALRTWHDGLLVSMTQQMYNSRDFSAMPVLADALEEAGCTDRQILAHCRGGEEHVRGCHLLDLLLEKG
jgi:hypothetical protein